MLNNFIFDDRLGGSSQPVDFVKRTSLSRPDSAVRQLTLANASQIDRASAIVFSGRGGLDIAEVRMSVVRIPEVSLRLREAQQIIDEQLRASSVLETIDLLSTLLADDAIFFKNLALKTLCCGVVQVGLFERYLRLQRHTEFFAGPSYAESALSVVLGERSFRDMILTSQALPQPLRGSAANNFGLTEPAPLLAGISMTELRLVQLVENGEGKIEAITRADRILDARNMIRILTEQRVRRFVSIGPVGMMRVGEFKLAAGSDEIEVIDSIELDPMLNWFWQNSRLHW